MAVVKQSAKATQTAVDNEEWVRATNLWSMTELAVSAPLVMAVPLMIVQRIISLILSIGLTLY